MDEFRDYNIAFVYNRSTTIANGNHDIDVLLSLTSDSYFSLANHSFIHEVDWSKDFHASSVIVLSENASRELFGNTNALHLHVEIEGQLFEVGGIIGQENPSEPNFAWVPYNHHSNRISHVSGIYISGKSYCSMQLHVLATRFAHAADLDLGSLRFIDLDQYAYNILVKFNLFYILAGGLVVMLFAIRFFHAIESHLSMPDMPRAIIYGALTLLFSLLCVFLWQITEPNLPLSFEAYALRPFIDTLNNRNAFEGINYLSLGHQKLHDFNRLSSYPLLIGAFAFAALAILGFTDTYAMYKQHSKKSVPNKSMTIPEYALVRIIQAIPAFIVMTLFIFFVMNLMRGPAMREHLFLRYLRYMLSMLQGDFGFSLGQGGIDRSIRPISELLIDAFPTTAVLVFGSIIVSGVSGAILGIIAALKHNKLLDHIIMIFTLFASAIPIFFLAALLLLIVSGERLGWITEYSSLDNWRTMVLPILSLAIPAIAFITRATRTAMLDVMKAQHITAARARGLPERKLIIYAISNVRISIVNITALQLVEMFMGTVIIEEVFGMNGLGQQLLWAINFRDQSLMMGIIIVFSLIFMIVNLSVDLLSIIIDPRVAKSFR